MASQEKEIIMNTYGEFVGKGYHQPAYGQKTYSGTVVEELIPAEESKFRRWYEQISAELDLDADPDDYRHYYDYRGYWKKYGEDKAGMGRDPSDENRWHFTDEFKLKGHPTYPSEPFKGE